MPDLLRHREVATRLGLGASTLFELVRKGEFPRPISVGRSKRYLSTEVEAWLAAKAAERHTNQGA